MRTFFGIVIAVVIAATIWWTFPIQAKQQRDRDSIDPLAITGTVTSLLPEVHYDHGFVFHEQQ
jgi:hypothetical protein